MSLRVVTSLNWLFGTLAIGLALLLPFAQDRLVVAVARTAVEAQVTAIVDAQKRFFPLRERYLPFQGTAAEAKRAADQLGIGIPVKDFLFDAFTDDKSALVVRAFTAPSALGAGAMPPMLYRYRIPYDGEPAGEWVALSGRTPGLVGLSASFAAMF